MAGAGPPPETPERPKRHPKGARVRYRHRTDVTFDQLGDVLCYVTRRHPVVRDVCEVQGITGRCAWVRDQDLYRIVVQ